MATAYTSLLGLALPVTGELQGTWGTTVNDAITSLLDTAVAGTTTLSADSDVTLSTTTGAANQARQAIILWTANGTVTRNITAPAQSKVYVVINASAGTQDIVIRGVGPTTGVTVAKGEKVVVAWNGSDFVRIASYGGTGEFTTVDTTNLEVTNIKAKDGTAAATIADSTGVVTVSQAPVMSALTASQAVFTTAGKALVSNAITGSGNVVMSASPTLTGTVAGASLQLSSLTSGRVTYAGASGLLQDSANLTFNGTDLTVSGAVNAGTVNATTFDMTNLEVTNIKAKDGTAAASIADSTGIITVSTQLNVDNLNLSGNTLSSTDANGNIVLAPNGTGGVQLDADTVRVGDSGAAATITTNGAGNLTLSTNSGTNSGTILINQGTNGNIELTPNGTGDVYLNSDTVRIGDANANATLTTNGTGDLILNTNAGTNSGSITIADAANGDISLTPNGNGSVVITNAGTSNALRITQTGSGNALLVEDDTNPDASPFLITANGRVVSGNTSAVRNTNFTAYNDTTSGLNSAFNGRYANSDTGSSFVIFDKARGTHAAPVVVQAEDNLGQIRAFGYDGTGFIEAATITAIVDGTPGTNDMPGRITFSTTADGASSPTERMRIDNSGRVAIGTATSDSSNLRVFGLTTGNVNQYGVLAEFNAQSGVTNAQYGFSTSLGTQAASFTLANLRHFAAVFQSVGAGSTVTNQVGFFADGSLTGATNNYGFYSNIASGTGRWNFYANGTADNFFGGPTTISVNSSSNALRITQTGAGNALVVEDSANPDATPFVVNANGQVISGNTVAASVPDYNGTLRPTQFSVEGETYQTSSVAIVTNVALAGGPTFSLAKSRGTNAAPNAIVNSNDALGTVNFSGNDGTAFIRAASITSAVDGTPGTNDMPGRLVFSTTADGASTPTERMRIDSAGNVGIGSTPIAGQTFTVSKNITGSTIAMGVRSVAQIQTDVTNQARMFDSSPTFAAGAFSIGALYHYYSTQGAIGGATLTNQYGFYAESSLTAATNNFGFFSNIASGTGRWNFYANGTAQNYFAGNTLIGTTTNTNSSALVVNGTISETVSSVQYLVASQYDVGTDPNEIPVNGNLGALAFMDSQFQQLAVGTGITGGTGTICKTSSGMEGGVSVTRILIDLTGLNSGGTAGDIIGVNGTANPCYILALPSVTVLGGRMTCLEAPAGGDTDIDLYSATEGTGVEDQAITALTETQLINGGVQALGTTTYFAADPTFNGYLYLVGQGTANATYTAGRFLIEIFGVQP